MSYFQYNLNDSSGSFVQIHYDISYDQVTNTSTVAFTNSWYRAFGDAEAKTYCDTDIVVTATDSNEKAESGIHFVQNIYSGRQFFDPIPTPQSVTVKHSNTSGVKTITIYSYTKRSARNTYKGSKTVTIETGEYTYGKALPPTSVTLNKDKATRDDNEVKLDWSGAIAGLNNPIKGYNVKYQLEEGGSIKDTRIITVESNNFVFTPQELIGAKKNQIITLSISAISTYGDGILDSDYSTTKSLTIINKAPEKPTFSTSGYLRINDNVTIDNAATIIIKDLKSQDADGDTLTYHYQVANEFTENNGDYVWGVYNDNGEFVPNTTTIQLPQQKEIKMLLDEPVIRIRSYDGEAYSDWSDPWKVPANTEPFLKGIVPQVSSQNIATSINGERQYVKEFSSLTASIDKDGAKITYYLWEFNWGTSIESNILNESKIYNFIPGAADADYGGGKEIEVRLSVVDESGDEFTTEYLSLIHI